MKKLWMTLAFGGAAVFSANPALADGYAQKAAPATCCASNWSGFYVGAGVGVAAFITKETDVITPPAAPPVNDPFDGLSGRDIMGTVAIGLDRQVAPGVVIGIFADYDFTDAEFTHANALTESIRLRDIWSVGGRVGLVRDCCALWYATAGYSSTEFRHRLADFATYSFNDRLDGWFAGLGVEQQIGRGLALKLEYRYTRFEDTSFSFTDFGGNRHDITNEPELHTVRLGLTYKFDGDRRDVVPLK